MEVACSKKASVNYHPGMPFLLVIGFYGKCRNQRILSLSYFEFSDFNRSPASHQTLWKYNPESQESTFNILHI